MTIVWSWRWHSLVFSTFLPMFCLILFSDFLEFFFISRCNRITWYMDNLFSGWFSYKPDKSFALQFFFSILFLVCMNKKLFSRIEIFNTFILILWSFFFYYWIILPNFVLYSVFNAITFSYFDLVSHNILRILFTEIICWKSDCPKGQIKLFYRLLILYFRLMHDE